MLATLDMSQHKAKVHILKNGTLNLIKVKYSVILAKLCTSKNVLLIKVLETHRYGNITWFKFIRMEKDSIAKK